MVFKQENLIENYFQGKFFTKNWCKSDCQIKIDIHSFPAFFKPPIKEINKI